MEQECLSPDIAHTELFRLFVYGTLKRGFENHMRFFDGGICASSAWCPGILFDTPWDHPVARVPKDLILAYGTSDTSEDLALQNRLQLK
ncbi:AIG2 family protein, partial [mine drainage metagenome]